MPAVCAGNLAASAADAAFPVELGENHGIPLQCICGGAEGVQGQAHGLFDAGKALFRQVQVQASFQIVDDPVAVLHHRQYATL